MNQSVWHNRWSASAARPVEKGGIPIDQESAAVDHGGLFDDEPVLRHLPLAFTGTYMAFAALWILTSDAALQRLVASPSSLTELQTAKGCDVLP